MQHVQWYEPTAMSVCVSNVISMVLLRLIHYILGLYRNQSITETNGRFCNLAELVHISDCYIYD
jgi:hypothetical protein